MTSTPGPVTLLPTRRTRTPPLMVAVIGARLEAATAVAAGRKASGRHRTSSIPDKTQNPSHRQRKPGESKGEEYANQTKKRLVDRGKAGKKSQEEKTEGQMGPKKMAEMISRTWSKRDTFNLATALRGVLV
jgi:hypothetical protein